MGDEAILSAMLTDLCERRDDLEFIVVSGNPTETAASYDVLSVHWQDIGTLLGAAKEILGGGGIFQDHWGISFYSAIGMLAALYQKPFMIYSVGVRPVTSEKGKGLTRWTFDLANICTVREQESKDILISLRILEKKVEITSGPALTFSFDSPLAIEILQLTASTQIRHLYKEVSRDSVAGRSYFYANVSKAELRRRYQTCELFVALSLFESFGLIFQEAMKDHLQ
jgi:hypothetical protein